ncbi:hypothetical protein NE237_026173 [Protea cynaroides]|uniref:Uncharacterized protein n=1 Tax=Protea cynaroides TaxID=273540 RepID=A0A9Q0H391_9MAGN|nr:hypothetical protein NE237_026173 [Protea cynaroides]
MGMSKESGRAMHTRQREADVPQLWPEFGSQLPMGGAVPVVNPGEIEEIRLGPGLGEGTHRWSAKDKGKGFVIGEPIMIKGVDTMNMRETGGTSGQKQGMGSRTFAQVVGGLPDLNSLPDPVVSGGVTRVVLPQDVVDRQLAKYQLALIGGEENRRQPTAEKVRRTTVDGTVNDLDAVSGKPLGRWADAFDDEDSDNADDVESYEDEEVEGVQEGEIQPSKPKEVAVAQTHAVTSESLKKGVVPDGVVGMTAQQSMPLVQVDAVAS